MLQVLGVRWTKDNFSKFAVSFPLPIWPEVTILTCHISNGSLAKEVFPSVIS